MNDLKQITHAYFLGIGGIGMSAICRYLLKRGIRVYGYDKTATPLTEELEQLGAIITFDDSVEALPTWIHNSVSALYVITPAIPNEHPQKQWFEKHQRSLLKRSEVLGYLTKNTICLAVAGTHGKTTTSTLLAHILKTLDIEFSAFLGGISSNYDSNYVENTTGKSLFNEPITVVEADEFDRSFHRLEPSAAIVTAIDADHLDIYDNEEAFVEAFVTFTQLIKDKSSHSLFVSDTLKNNPFKQAITYGTSPNSRYRISHIEICNTQYQFQLESPHELCRFECGLAGRHNVFNAAAALALLNAYLGLPLHTMTEAIKSFKGVKRRFEYLVKTETHRVIDDYAHHPEELQTAIASVRELYPNTRVSGIFQPHLFSRTRDFAEEFARVLGTLDQLWLLEIYPAREKPIPGINATYLKSLIRTDLDVVVISKEELIETLQRHKPETLIILGAGDIDTLRNPIMNIYE